MYGIRIWKDNRRLAYGILIYFVLLHAHLDRCHAAIIIISHVHRGGVTLRKLINLIRADASLTEVALSGFGHGLQREHLVRRADIVDADSLYLGVQSATGLLWFLLVLYFAVWILLLNLAFYLLVFIHFKIHKGLDLVFGRWRKNLVLVGDLWLFNRFHRVCCLSRLLALVFERHRKLLRILWIFRIVVIIDQIQTGLGHKPIQRWRVSKRFLNLTIQTRFTIQVTPGTDVLLVHRHWYVLNAFFQWGATVIFTWAQNLIGTPCAKSILWYLDRFRHLFNSIPMIVLYRDLHAIGSRTFEYLLLLRLMNLQFII